MPLRARDFKSLASANSAIPAKQFHLIALYQSAYRRAIASGTGHVPLHIMAAPCTRAMDISSLREWYMVGRTTSPHNLISQIRKRYYMIIGHNRQGFSKKIEASFRELSGHVRMLKNCPFCPLFSWTKSRNSLRHRLIHNVRPCEADICSFPLKLRGY